MTTPSEDEAMKAFRTEVSTWIEANFPFSLRGKASLVLAIGESQWPDDDLRVWKSRLGGKGWGAPTWPTAYGGGGLSAPQEQVLRQELSRAEAFNPILTGMGVSMVGPTILDYGTEAQKQRHIPPMARGDLRWCIGYSEPNAGSDLASLQTKAEDAGDHFIVNGQKIWTSGAQYADWCGCLVRTDPEAPKHDGISFVLVNMRQAGVETRPIKLIAGVSPFCETFFTDARAEKDDLLGELNRGWSVGKRLLQHERASQTGAASQVQLQPLPDIARRYVEFDDAGRMADGDLRTRVTDHLMRAKAHELTIARAVAEARIGPSNTASVLKNSATAVAQTRAELLLEIMGSQGLGWEGEGFDADELAAVRGWLAGKAMSIYGGSAEIQSNIISKRILGLPEMTQQDG